MYLYINNREEDYKLELLHTLEQFCASVKRQLFQQGHQKSCCHPYSTLCFSINTVSQRQRIQHLCTITLPLFCCSHQRVKWTQPSLCPSAAGNSPAPPLPASPLLPAVNSITIKKSFGIICRILCYCTHFHLYETFFPSFSLQ